MTWEWIPVSQTIREHSTETENVSHTFTKMNLLIWLDVFV